MKTRWSIAVLLAVAIALPFVPACGDSHQDPQAGQSADASGLCAADAKPADLNLTLKDTNGADVDLAMVRQRLSDAQRTPVSVGVGIFARSMALGGLGPLWAVYDADRLPEMAAKSLPERFSGCPWALYHIEVMA